MLLPLPVQHIRHLLTRLVWLAPVVVIELVANSAFAQTKPVPGPAIGTPSTQVPAEQVVDGQTYTYVEQMPQLPDGGGMSAIREAVISHVNYPPVALRQHIEGSVLVGFVVGQNGLVRDVKILRSLGGGCDEESLAAVRRLPRFIPGRQAGKPVAVAFTLPINFRIPATPLAPSDTLMHVYPLVDRMPHLPDIEGSMAIFQTIQRALAMPAEVVHDTLPRKVFVGFIVGPSGVIRDVKIVRGLSPACNAAALAAVQKLPRLVGGTLNGVPASVSMTVPILFGRLPKE